MKSKTPIILLVLGFLVFFSIGCSSKGSKSSKNGSDNKTIELVFTYWGSPGEKRVIDEAVKQFEEKHTNIKVKRMHIPDDFQTKITAMVSSNEAPDLTYSNPDFAMPWAEEGTFLNMQELMESDPTLSRVDFLDHTWYDYGKDQSLGPMQAVVTPTLLYNTDAFKDAGIDIPPQKIEEAWSWDEFVDTAKTLTLDVNGNNAHSANFDEKN